LVSIGTIQTEKVLYLSPAPCRYPGLVGTDIMWFAVVERAVRSDNEERTHFENFENFEILKAYSTNNFSFRTELTV
jgi:hypothetical protein